MKFIYNTVLLAAFCFFGVSCQTSSPEVAVSLNEAFNVPFGQSITLPDQSKLIFAQVLNVNSTFQPVSTLPKRDTRVKVVLCKTDNQKEDIVLSMGKSVSLESESLGNVELQFIDLLAGVESKDSHSDYMLRMSLVDNQPRP